MQCNQCRLVEMRVERVEDNKVIHRCPKCGTEYEETRDEDE